MTATASLGVIHRGHEKEALTLMQAYLPKETNSPGYVESGSLYALGLIHANHGANIIDYLLSQTRDTSSDVSSLLLLMILFWKICLLLIIFFRFNV